MAIGGPLLRPSEKGERRPTVRSNGRAVAKVSRFEILKDKIRGWWEDRFKVGEYLKEIKDGKLYKSDYATFEEFCESEFGIKQAYAYRLIEASDVKTSVSDSTIVEKLVRPSQATALAAVPVEQREEVLTKVAESGPVTAKAITEVAQTITPKPAPSPKLEKEVHHDKTGYPIPEGIWEDWQRAEGFGSNLRELSRIKGEISRGLEGEDVIFREINSSSVSALTNLYAELKCVLPYAVCTSCQGRQKSKCSLCKQRGFISEFAYKQFVPAETKAMREKARAK